MHFVFIVGCLWSMTDFCFSATGISFSLRFSVSRNQVFLWLSECLTLIIMGVCFESLDSYRYGFCYGHIVTGLFVVFCVYLLFEMCLV